MQKILDKKIVCGSKFTDTIKLAVEQKSCTAISFVNPFSYLEVLKEDALVKAIDYYFSDGALLCKMHRIFHQKIERASFDFSSIADEFLTYLSQSNLSLAIVGAKQAEIELAILNLQKMYPKLNISYFCNGYIDDEQALIQTLNNHSPNVVLLGMGSPYQERMSVTLKEQLEKTALIITCGGFLTQTSIKADYYHPIVKKLGVRWLQRMIMHKHVRNRVFKDYPKFLYSYLHYHLKKNQD